MPNQVLILNMLPRITLKTQSGTDKGSPMQHISLVPVYYFSSKTWQAVFSLAAAAGSGVSKLCCHRSKFWLL